jgi:hypothetical protein
MLLLMLLLLLLCQNCTTDCRENGRVDGNYGVLCCLHHVVIDFDLTVRKSLLLLLILLLHFIMCMQQDPQWII